MGKKRKKGQKVRILDSDTPFGDLYSPKPAVSIEEVEDPKALMEEYLDRMPNFDPNEWKSDSDHASDRRKTATKSSQDVQIDLHGLFLDEAIYKVDSKIRELLNSKAHIINLKVITGKGRHSGPEGGVLPKEIHSYVRKKFKKHIVRMEESPADCMINGLPFRGHFTVVLTSKGC